MYAQELVYLIILIMEELNRTGAVADEAQKKAGPEAMNLLLIGLRAGVVPETPELLKHLMDDVLVGIAILSKTGCEKCQFEDIKSLALDVGLRIANASMQRATMSDTNKDRLRRMAELVRGRREESLRPDCPPDMNHPANAMKN